MTQDLPELLVGTIGLAHVAKVFADQVQAGNIECEFSIGLNHGRVSFVRTRVGHVDVLVADEENEVLIQDRDVRAVFAVLYGALAAEFDEPLPTTVEAVPTPAVAADLAAALELLDTAMGMMGGESDETNPDALKFFERAEALRARYPRPA